MCRLFLRQWVEHVCACQLGILGNLVLCRLMSCRPWGGHRVSDVWLCIGVWVCDILASIIIIIIIIIIITIIFFYPRYQGPRGVWKNRRKLSEWPLLRAAITLTWRNVTWSGLHHNVGLISYQYVININNHNELTEFNKSSTQVHYVPLTLTLFVHKTWSKWRQKVGKISQRKWSLLINGGPSNSRPAARNNIAPRIRAALRSARSWWPAVLGQNED